MKHDLYQSLFLSLLLVLGVAAVDLRGQKAGEEVIDLKSIKLKDLAQKEIPGGAREGETLIADYGKEWWVTEVEFTTTVEIVEEVSVRVFLEGYDILGRNKDPMENPVTLTSEVTFINLLEGQHVASFYLHPSAAKRYGGNKARDFRKYIYRIEIRAGGQLIHEQDSDDDLGEGWHREGQQIEDVLLPAHESPWWPAESTRYDQIQLKRR